MSGCSNHVFYFLFSFDIWGVADSEETAPSRVNQFLEIVNNLPVNPSFISKPTHPELTPQPLPLLGSHTAGRYPPILTAPGPSIKQRGAASPFQIPRNDLKWQIQACLPSLAHFFPWKPQSCLLPTCPPPFASWLILVLSHVSLVLVCPPPSSWELCVINYLFNGNHLLKKNTYFY